MIKTGKLLAGICLVCMMGGCSDDGRDDTVLDMSNLTGKDWYYNAWLGEKYSFGSRDLLEVVRFERGGTLKNIDFSGRREYVVGKWTADGNRIEMRYDQGDAVKWNVQHSGEDYIRTIVNEQGVREYTSGPGILGDLTADAFLVNEYTFGNQFKTYVGADVRGNIDVREGSLILASGKSVGLANHDYYWTEEAPVYIDFDGKDQEVRFYLRLGKDTHLKLSDSIYSENLILREPSEVNLKAMDKEGAVWVTWNPYPVQKVSYRVDILSEMMDVAHPYFVSRVQPVSTAGLQIRSTTAGDVNRISEMKSGKTYVVRLTALLYEPGIDFLNDNYGYANVQAISVFTEKFVWK